MAKRTNAPNYGAAATQGSRPAGNSARLPTASKVGVEGVFAHVDTFTGRVPGAMKGVVGGSGSVDTNSRPFKSQAGAKGIDRSLRGGKRK